MTPDIISGLVSGAYGLSVFLHCRKLAQSGRTEGTSLLSLVAGFAVCVVFGMMFWKSELWWSFGGNAVIAASNLTWLSMVIYFSLIANRARPGPVSAPRVFDYSYGYTLVRTADGYGRRPITS